MHITSGKESVFLFLVPAWHMVRTQVISVQQIKRDKYHSFYKKKKKRKKNQASMACQKEEILNFGWDKVWAE